MRATFLLPLLLVACGDTIGVGDTSDTSDTAGGDPGATFAMRVDSVRLADEDEGFDLDGHATSSSSDPIGCGKVDASGGVDNELAGLESTMSMFGFDLDAAFADAIASGDLVIDMTVTGYHGEDDPDVLLDVSSNGSLVASGVHGSVTGGVLSASLDALPLSGEIGGSTFSVTTRSVVLSLPLSNAPDATYVTGGLLGGGVPWDEAGESDLRALVLANAGSFASMAEGVAQGALDLLPSGATSGSCDAISTALIVDASAL